MLSQRIKQEYQRIQNQLEYVNQEIKKLPDGKFFCCKSGPYSKWYRSDGHRQSYIPKSNRELAEKLAYKKYLTLLLEDLSHEQMALKFYLRHHSHDYGKATQLILDNPEYRQLLSKYMKPINQELAQWQSEAYEKNQNYPEHLKHKTLSGNLVRSKSEVIIDMVLYAKKIPFRYECALNLGDVTVYPDFTIRHPETGDTYYWEHFGIMDDMNYYRNAYSKMELYNACGIVPSIQLITTFETKENPLSLEMAEKIVEYYFE